MFYRKEVHRDMEGIHVYTARKLSDMANSLESLAKTFYISPCYLSRQFRQTTGFRLTEYIQNVRIINAQFLLSSTTQSVSNIAMACGFTSFSQFNRVFHQKSNCSPTEYRRSHGHSHWV